MKDLLHISGLLIAILASSFVLYGLIVVCWRQLKGE